MSTRNLARLTRSLDGLRSAPQPKPAGGDTTTGAAPLPPRTRTARFTAALTAAGINPAPAVAPPPWPDYIRTIAPEHSEAAARAQGRRS